MESNNYEILTKKNDENEIRNLLLKAKIYLDFGAHPGRDRLPREAVLSNCIVITGIKGSALNDIDIPIDKLFKFDHKDKNFYKNFAKLCNGVFLDYEFHLKKFNDYKKIVINDINEYKIRVEEFIKSL